MAEIDDATYERIKALGAEGDALLEREEYVAAIVSSRKGLCPRAPILIGTRQTFQTRICDKTSKTGAACSPGGLIAWRGPPLDNKAERKNGAVMRMNRGVSVLVGAVLLAGCGGEEHAEVTPEEVVGESMQVEAPAEEHPVTALAYCDDVTAWNTTWTSYENQVLTLVNQRRAAGATCGGVVRPPAPALTLDTRLRCAARKHSKDMAVNNYFSHTGLNGSTPWQRITWAGYTYRKAAENISAGYATPTTVVNGWMSSTGHCNNIMNPSLKHLGVGYYYQAGSTYGHYWTQDFGAQ